MFFYLNNSKIVGSHISCDASKFISNFAATLQKNNYNNFLFFFVFNTFIKFEFIEL